jgi:integrase
LRTRVRKALLIQSRQERLCEPFEGRGSRRTVEKPHVRHAWLLEVSRHLFDLRMVLLVDIQADDISRYQGFRKKQGASPKTINLEIGTLRAILRRNRLWVNLQPDVRMLRVRDDVGRALTADEEGRLLKACIKRRSRSLPIAVLLSLHTGLRSGELRLLRWPADRSFAENARGRKRQDGWRRRETGPAQRHDLLVPDSAAPELSRGRAVTLRLPIRALRSDRGAGAFRGHRGPLCCRPRDMHRVLEGSLDKRAQGGRSRLPLARHAP